MDQPSDKKETEMSQESQTPENDKKEAERSQESQTPEKDKPAVCYIHNLSPMKVSQAHNDYFDATLQMKGKTLRAVCFSPEKIKSFKAKYESSSPIQLSNYTIKKNKFTDEEEVHINKRTKLSDPQPSEIDFNIADLQNVEDLTTKTKVNEIVAHNSKSKVNVAGRVTFQGSAETIQSNGKTLNKQEAVLTDETGSIRLVLWESDITKVKSGCSYDLTRAMVKAYQSQNYITINKQTSLKQTEMKVGRQDDQLIENDLYKVSCPADGVEKIITYLSCKKCNASFPLEDKRKVLQCSSCGCAQLKAKCKKRTLMKGLFLKDDERVTLTIFDDHLKTLYNIYKKQADITATFSDLTEDDMMEFILSVEATVLYNKKFTVKSVKYKDN